MKLQYLSITIFLLLLLPSPIIILLLFLIINNNSPHLILLRQAQFQRFGAIVTDLFIKPGVPEGFFGGDAAFGVVDEDLAEEVDELFVEGGGGGNDVLLVDGS